MYRTTYALLAATAMARHTKHDSKMSGEELPDSGFAPDMDDAVMIDGVPTPIGDLSHEEREEVTFGKIKNVIYLVRETWTGLHQGLYGPTGAAAKPDPECFGEWISDDFQFIGDYFYMMKNDFWAVTYEDTTQLAYDIVDLIFLQDQYCHFRSFVYDIINYCQLEEQPCNGKGVLSSMQTNAFGMVTQVSGVVSDFTANKWSDMDVEAKGYTLHQLGAATSGIVSDILGFHLVESTF